MPRPTPVQFAYGSATVICSTLAMLLLTRAESGTGIALIAAAALGLGLLVALTAPVRIRRTAARRGAVSRPSHLVIARHTSGVERAFHEPSLRR